jgi:hypothetical protein
MKVKPNGAQGGIEESRRVSLDRATRKSKSGFQRMLEN